MPEENPVRPSSDHRRRVTIVLTVLSALIVVDLVVRANPSKLAPYRWDSYFQKLEGLRSESPRPQIILLGSSRARFGLVPEVFENLTGKRTFNAGIDGSQVLECRRIAEDYIEKLRPELVVLGVNARAFREDYLPIPAACHLFSWDDFLHYCHTDGWSSKVVGKFLIHNSKPVSATFRRREEIRFLILEQLDWILPKYAQQARDRRKYVARPKPPNGYEHPWVGSADPFDLQAQLDQQGEIVGHVGTPVFSSKMVALHHFESLLDWFDEKGIPIIIAYIPNSPRTEARWAAVEPGMIHTLERLCEKHAVPFIPCSQEDVPRENRDFMDEMHVGFPLARRLSERIARTVVAMRLVTPSETHLAQTSENEPNAP